MEFYVATTLIFWALFFIWNKDDLHNLCLKIVFFLMAGWATFLLMTTAGYIIKV